MVHFSQQRNKSHVMVILNDVIVSGFKTNSRESLRSFRVVLHKATDVKHQNVQAGPSDSIILRSGAKE